MAASCGTDAISRWAASARAHLGRVHGPGGRYFPSVIEVDERNLEIAARPNT